MRPRPVLVVVVLALAGLLTGCGAASGPAAATSPAASASGSASAEPSAEPAADLAGTTWSVQDAAGVDPGTTARFDATSVAVSDGDRTSSLQWATQGDQLLATRSSAAMDGPVATAWLTSAVRAVRTRDGWTTLDARGAQTARLTAGSAASGGTPLPAVTPGPGVTDAAPSALEGRWHLDGHPAASIRFSDGRWDATASCETRTPGGSGAYRVLPGGRLLVTRSIALRLGCPIAQGLADDRSTAIVGIVRATSFVVQGDVLTLFDRTGAPLGSLVR